MSGPFSGCFHITDWTFHWMVWFVSNANAGNKVDYDVHVGYLKSKKIRNIYLDKTRLCFLEVFRDRIGHVGLGSPNTKKTY